MIQYDFAKDLMSQIEELIKKYQEQDKFRYVEVSRLKGAHYDYLFNRESYGLPYHIVDASEEIVITSTHFEITEYYYGRHVNKISDEEIEKRLKIETSGDAITPWYAFEHLDYLISNYSFFYNKVLETVREMDYWQGIQDEEKLIKNYIIHYNQVLQSEDKVLNIFTGISFPKPIADLITKILIRYLNHRLKVLNPIIENDQIIPLQLGGSRKNKLIWRGQQKELAELIIQLQVKGWIGEIRDREHVKAANAICDLFDISHTSKTGNTNEVNSFYQIIKGRKDDNGEKIYDQVFTPTYKPRFSGIINNPFLESL